MENGRNTLRGLSRPSLIYDLASSRNEMVAEEVSLADSVARQKQAAERFKESLFATFSTIKGFMDGQQAQIQQIEDKQQTLEERHDAFKVICESNFKNGSNQLQYLLQSTDHLYELINLAGNQLGYVANAVQQALLQTNMKVSGVESSFLNALEGPVGRLAEVEKLQQTTIQVIESLNSRLEARLTEIESKTVKKPDFDSALRDLEKHVENRERELENYSFQHVKRLEDYVKDELKLHKCKGLETLNTKLASLSTRLEELEKRILPTESQSSKEVEFLLEKVGVFADRLTSIEKAVDSKNPGDNLVPLHMDDHPGALSSGQIRTNKDSLQNLSTNVQQTNLDMLSIQELKQLKRTISKKIKKVARENEREDGREEKKENQSRPVHNSARGPSTTNKNKNNSYSVQKQENNKKPSQERQGQNNHGDHPSSTRTGKNSSQLGGSQHGSQIRNNNYGKSGQNKPQNNFYKPGNGYGGESSHAKGKYSNWKSNRPQQPERRESYGGPKTEHAPIQQEPQKPSSWYPYNGSWPHYDSGFQPFLPRRMPTPCFGYF